MFWTYILKSAKTGKYYIGYTNDLKARLDLHNAGKVKSTKNFRPWKLFYEERHEQETAAIRRERQIKSWKSRRAIERLKF